MSRDCIVTVTGINTDFDWLYHVTFVLLETADRYRAEGGLYWSGYMQHLVVMWAIPERSNSYPSAC